MNVMLRSEIDFLKDQICQNDLRGQYMQNQFHIIKGGYEECQLQLESVVKEQQELLL